MTKKILAVDDDERMRELYKSALEEEGFEVRTAADATGGVMLCHDFKPDLLILDWEMPGGGGKWVFEKIRELLGNPLPVLFITGHAAELKIALSAPKVAALKKPVDIATMISTIRGLLR